MIVQKWNFKKHEYETISVDDITFHSPLYTTNMGERVNCINCKKDTVFGACYTSRQYHDNNGFGFGYPVCEECYKKEVELDLKNSL